MRSFLLSRVAFVVLAAVVGATAPVRATVVSDGGPAPSFLRVVDKQVFFATYDASQAGWSLWKTNGTPGGIVLLRAGLGLDIELVPVGDRLVFSTRGALWTSDGTPEGTVVVAERIDLDADAAVALQLRSADGAPWCAHIPASEVRAVKRGLRFDDPNGAVASAGGLTRLRWLRTKRGATMLTAGGADTSFVAAEGALHAVVALVAPNGARTCARATGTLAPSRRGGLKAVTARHVNARSAGDADASDPSVATLSESSGNAEGLGPG